jgi:plasmid maintenance system antidote protein VapI
MQMNAHGKCCRSPAPLPRWASTRTTLSELVNEKRGISPEIAAHLSQVFGGSAESWLTQQARYDLAHPSRRGADRIQLKRLECA